ncbi:MAG TPA: hypothetical protein PKE30_11020 [Niabella sp.]|nr:hypothetical protein [Niabella sp.]
MKYKRISLIATIAIVVVYLAIYHTNFINGIKSGLNDFLGK